MKDILSYAGLIHLHQLSLPGLDAKDIINVIGHKNVQSVTNYIAAPTGEQKHTYSSI